MNGSLLRQASLCLALLSPLFVASCTSPATRGLPQGLTSQNCADCVVVNVKTWFFTPSAAGDLQAVLQSLNSISPLPLNEEDRLRIISPSHDRAVPGLLSKKGKLDLIADGSSVTTSGRPFSVSTEGLWDTSGAVLTPLPLFGKSQARVINFDFSTNLPEGGSPLPVNKAFNSGRVVLRNGASLLLIQQVKNDYVVWLVSVGFATDQGAE